MADYGYAEAENEDLLLRTRVSQERGVTALAEFIALNAAADFSAQEAHPEWFGGEAQPTGDDAIDGRFRKLRDCLSCLRWVIETSECSRTRQRKLADARLAASSLEEMLEWRDYDPAETACLMWMACAFNR